MLTRLMSLVLSVLMAVTNLYGSLLGDVDLSVRKPTVPVYEETNLALHASFDNAAAEKNLTDYYSFTTFSLDEGESVTIDFGKKTSLNSVVLEEDGDNVELFRFYKYVDGEWEMFYEQQRILSYRLCFFEQIETEKLKIEMVECIEPVKLKNLEVYNLAKKDPIKVSQYLSFGDIVSKRDTGDEGFSGYYDVVTDVIVIGQIRLDENGNVTFEKGEEFFAENLQALKDIIGDRPVRIWLTVLFGVKGQNGQSNLDTTKDFLNANLDRIGENLKRDVVEKYGVYGIDYDWEYPTEKAQWRAYGDLINKTAEFTKVSVALAGWGSGVPFDAVRNIEHVNVMTYDMFDGRGDHSNIEVGTVSSMKNMMKNGFKKEQILLGIPAYGRDALGTVEAWPNYRGNEDKLGKFNKIVHGVQVHDENGNLVTTDAYIQSYAEARDKTKYAQEVGAGGVMLFQAVCDSPYTYEYSLHRGIGEAINSGA